jgi:hypothetical protein
MEETAIEDLAVRFGYPYVYVHQVPESGFFKERRKRFCRRELS